MRLDEAASALAGFRVYRPLFSAASLARAARALLSRRRDGWAPPPFMVGWLATFACNATCDFCNVKPLLRQKSPLLSATQIRELAEGFSIFAIGGGEPLARSDMFEVLRGLKARNVRTLIITNGMLLHADKAQTLADIAPDIVMVSLHGGPKHHDEVMGAPGAWDKTWCAMQALLQARRGTRVIINCVVDGNVNELRAVAEAGRALGVDGVRYTMVTFMTEAEVARSQNEGLMPTSYIRPSPPEVDPDLLVAEMRALRRDFGSLVSVHPVLRDEQMAAWFGESGGTKRACTVMRHTLFLQPDGTVVPCPYLLDHPLGNVTEQPLEEIWNSHEMRALRLRRDREAFTVCARCCKT